MELGNWVTATFGTGSGVPTCHCAFIEWEDIIISQLYPGIAIIRLKSRSMSKINPGVFIACCIGLIGFWQHGDSVKRTRES